MKALFHNTNFQLLLIAQFVSLLGDRLGTIVFFSIAVSIVGSQNSIYPTLLFATQFIPLFLFGYFFGQIADMYKKQYIMMSADFIRAILVLILIFCYESLVLLYIIVFLIGFFEAMFEPSKKSIIPYIVGKKDLIYLNRIYAVFEMVAIFFGVAIGIFLLEYFTIRDALIFDAFSYLFSMVLISFIRYKERPSGITKKEISIQYRKLKDGITTGLKYIADNHDSLYVIRNITILTFFTAGFFYATVSDFVIRNSSGAHDAGIEIGITLLIVAFGAITSPLFNYPLKRFSDSRISQGLYLIGGLVLIEFFLLLMFNKSPYFLIFFVFFIAGIIIGLQYMRILYLLHLTTKKSYLGRVISINDIASSLSIITGTIVGSIINELFTYVFGFFFCGMIYLIGFFLYRKIIEKISW